MNRYKICVYAICKNEEKFTDRWMDSMQEADLVVVTDTGSTDDTAERLRARGAEVHIRTVTPWRFDTARNISLSFVPEDADICVCTDLDEVLSPGWRDALEKAWADGTKRAYYLYNWSFRKDGTPDVTFMYSKVHTRHDYRWVCPIHEVLEYIGPQPEITVTIDGMILNHYPEHKESRGSYLPLLELAVNEDAKNARMAYYLGREYTFHSMWEKAIEALMRHLAMPTAYWKAERSAAMRLIAKSCHKLGRDQEAYGWYVRAMEEHPVMRESFVDCAQMAYELSNWPLVIAMAREAFRITEKSKEFINAGTAWDQTLDDLCAVAYYRLGLLTHSLVHARAALAVLPGDKRLQNNVALIEKALREKTPDA